MRSGDGDQIGKLLHKNWTQKRQLADGITDKNIDSWYEKSLSNGATGGKMIGAVGGGFLLLFANPDKQENIIRALLTFIIIALVIFMMVKFTAKANLQ